MNPTRIIWAVVMVVGVVLLVLVAVPWKQPSRSVGLNLLSPVLVAADRVEVFVHRFQKGFSTLEELENEASSLREQNAQLTTENTVLKDMAAENARLRELLGFKKATQYRLLAARMVSRDPRNWWSNILINRGFIDDEGLRSDLAVINARGVIGKTGVVSRDVTEVILMSNQNCKIAAMVEDTKEQGILVGDGNMDNGKARSRLTYVSRNAQVAIGERVFTSGLGGVFPEGLLLGIISEVPPLSPQVNFGLYREVYVEPVVDLGQLNEMFVVLEAPVSDVKPDSASKK